MNKLSILSVGIALGVTLALMSMLCALAFAIWPDATLDFFGAFMHGLDLGPCQIDGADEPWPCSLRRSRSWRRRACWRVSSTHRSTMSSQPVQPLGKSRVRSCKPAVKSMDDVVRNSCPGWNDNRRHRTVFYHPQVATAARGHPLHAGSRPPKLRPSVHVLLVWLTHSLSRCSAATPSPPAFFLIALAITGFQGAPPRSRWPARTGREERRPSDLMSVVNFSIGSDFKWPLFACALVWALSLVAFAFETYASAARGRGRQSPFVHPRRNPTEGAAGALDQPGAGLCRDARYRADASGRGAREARRASCARTPPGKLREELHAGMCGWSRP